MASFNKVILLGNLTRDPELRQTPGGMTICKFSLAVNRKFRKADGTDQEEVTYVDLDSFGKQAETIGKYCTKGKPLFVEGRLRLDSWEKDGEKRSRMVVVVENFQFVGGRGDGDGGSQGAGFQGGGHDDAPSAPPQRQAGGYSRPAAPQSSARPPQQERRAAPPPPSENIDDDVPF